MALKDFLEHADKQQPLLEQLRTVSTPQALVDLAKSNKYDVSLAEATEAFAAGDELSDEDLDGVAGGACHGAGFMGRRG